MRRLPRWVIWWGIPGTTTRAIRAMPKATNFSDKGQGIKYGVPETQKLAREGLRMLHVAMLTRVVSVFLLSFLAYVPLSHGFETKGQDCAKCHTLNRDEARDLLKNVFPDIKVLELHVRPSGRFSPNQVGGRDLFTSISQRSTC